MILIIYLILHKLTLLKCLECFMVQSEHYVKVNCHYYWCRPKVNSVVTRFNEHSVLDFMDFNICINNLNNGIKGQWHNIGSYKSNASLKPMEWNIFRLKKTKVCVPNICQHYDIFTLNIWVSCCDLLHSLNCKYS